MQHHPDHGGEADTFKAIQNEFEECLARLIRGGFDSTEDAKGYRPGNESMFSEILASIISWNITIEIIGHWIYAFDSYEYKDRLKAMGFWFSKKHRAWVFSGTKKRRVRTRLTTDDVRNLHGSSTIREKERREAIA
jgi:hypothetical protein